MKEPRRLIADEQSPMMRQLLLAAQSERLPPELRHKMSHGVALALGGTSVGAGLAVSGTAQGALTGAQHVGTLAGSATSGAGGVSGLAGSQGLAGAGTSLGSSAASSWLAGAASKGAAGAATAAGLKGAVWLKGVVALGALVGVAGAGSVFGGWFSGQPEASVVDTGVQTPPTDVTPFRGAQPGEARGPSDVDRAPVQKTPVEQTAAPPAPAEERPQLSPDVKQAPARLGRPSRSNRPSTTKTAVPGDLGREVRLLDGARRAILAGDVDTAREKLATYGKLFPNGALRAEAASLAKTVASGR